MRIQIKPISTGYLTGLHAVLDAVAREGEYLVSTRAPAIDSTRQWVEGNIERGIPQYVALVEETTVVGWCDISPDSHPGFEHGGRLGVGVLLAHRRQGIGRRLVSTAVDGARAFGLTRVELEVFSSNEPAIRLYRQLGFELEGCRRRARKLRGGEYEDVLTMGLLLDADGA
jgi:RimJ/RimL family protein N-acetyltransferase